MLFRKSEKTRLDQYSWVPFQANQERTRALVLIESVLRYLVEKRAPLIMEQREGKSNPTILLGYSGNHLLIDSPPDWHLRTMSARFNYKDQDKLDCYFKTTIRFVKEGVIHTRIPEYLVRQQRRAHYRVEVPGGSEAVFCRQGGDQVRLAVKNVSAGGMLCCSKSDEIAVGSTLQNIALLLPPAARERFCHAYRVDIPQGLVVRTSADSGTGLFYYGISFYCRHREESNLLKYIRQREIELAKNHRL